MRRIRLGRAGLVLAGAMLALGLALLLCQPPAGLLAIQERVFDRMLQAVPLTGAPDREVWVVDIGATDESGAAWDRGDTARLVQLLAQAGPAALAFDIVFSGECEAAPTNSALSAALGQGPAVLGFLLGDGPAPPARPSLALSDDAGRLLWRAPGAEAACPAFTAEASSATVALVSDADGRVRRIPVAVLVGTSAFPSLSLEAVRLAQGRSAVLLGPPPAPWLHMGEVFVSLDPDGWMRLLPSPPEAWVRRSLRAEDVLLHGVPDGFRGAVVLVGSSLPERGGLRATATSPVHPSVQIHADAVVQLLAGTSPHRRSWAPPAEAGIAAAGSLVALAGVLVLPPLVATALAATFALLWVLASALVYTRSGILLDPLLPAAAIMATAVLTLIGRAAETGRAERLLRRRMGQLLPAAVVSRLAEHPHLLKLEGEARVVTALFTDIEGFSGMTGTLGPRDLVRVLDEYFTLTCGIVLRHGGMIDKLVGDSLHVLFNAPLDQPGHVDAALACALEICAATEAFRLRPDLAHAGLGRTRIGIETGPAVLGDVGSGHRIDYTAHGEAVNLAARLEEANKDLGTAICVGPGAAALARTALRPLGEIAIRSFGPVRVFTPDQSPTLAKAASIRP